MTRSVKIMLAVIAVTLSTAAISGAAKPAAKTASVELKQLLTFEKDFNKHINDAIRDEAKAAGTIWSTKCYKDVYETKLFNLKEASGAACLLNRSQLQEVREIVTRRVDDIIAEGAKKQSVDALVSGKLTP